MAPGFWMNNKNCYGCKTCPSPGKSEKQLDQGVLLRHVTEIKQDDLRRCRFVPVVQPLRRARVRGELPLCAGSRSWRTASVQQNHDPYRLQDARGVPVPLCAVLRRAGEQDVVQDMCTDRQERGELPPACPRVAACPGMNSCGGRDEEP